MSRRSPAGPSPLSFELDAASLAETRRLNRKLDRFPRMKIRRRADVLLIQSILRLSQMRANWTMRRAGITVERRFVGERGVAGQGVPVRILRPAAGPVRGVVLDLHGGGWVIGNARMNDHLNLAIIHACDVAVVSVDYRLLWHGTPVSALVEDCEDAATWLLRGDGLPEYRGLPVILVGESAGGHLAAVLLQRLHALPAPLNPIAGAVLFYGVYDFTGTPSVRRAGPDTLLLDGPNIAADLGRLAPGLTEDQRRQPALSPLYGNLAAMPPALMVVGELDPLLDDTILLAQRWQEAGAPVDLVRIPETPHGFIHFRSSVARRLLTLAHDWINRHLTAHPTGEPNP